MKCKKEDCFSCNYEECINDFVRKQHKYSQYDKEYGKKRRDEARANGMCTSCFKNKATHGVLCYECRLRQRRLDAERKQKKGRFSLWLGNGQCYFCGEKVINGLKVCEKHYKMIQVNLLKGKNMSEIKDSGNRTEFSTGAVRDVQEDKGRFDLAPLGVIARLYSSEPNIILNRINDFMESGDTEYLLDAVNRFVSAERKTVTEMMLEVSVHYMKGAKKYKPYNWMLGIPVSSYISSGVRHFLKHIDGHMDERHDLAFIWNMLGAVWTMEHKPEMIDIPFDLISGKNN